MQATLSNRNRPGVSGVSDSGNGEPSCQHNHPQEHPHAHTSTSQEDDRDLDAAGKGANRGTKGGLKCYKCGGGGHPERLCPTKPGVSVNCRNCGGKGHYQGDCTSKGGGKASPKGGGKGTMKGGQGGKSNFFFGKGSGSQGKGMSSLGDAPWMGSTSGDSRFGQATGTTAGAMDGVRMATMVFTAHRWGNNLVCIFGR